MLRLCGNLAHSVHFLHFASHLHSQHKLARVYVSSVLSVDSSGRSCAKGGEGTRGSGSVTHLTSAQESIIMLCNKRAKFTWDDVRAWTRSFYTKNVTVLIIHAGQVGHRYNQQLGEIHNKAETSKPYRACQTEEMKRRNWQLIPPTETFYRSLFSPHATNI